VCAIVTAGPIRLLLYGSGMATESAALSERSSPTPGQLDLAALGRTTGTGSIKSASSEKPRNTPAPLVGGPRRIDRQSAISPSMDEVLRAVNRLAPSNV